MWLLGIYIINLLSELVPFQIKQIRLWGFSNDNKWPMCSTRSEDVDVLYTVSTHVSTHWVLLHLVLKSSFLAREQGMGWRINWWLCLGTVPPETVGTFLWAKYGTFTCVSDMTNYGTMQSKYENVFALWSLSVRIWIL